MHYYTYLHLFSIFYKSVLHLFCVLYIGNNFTHAGMIILSIVTLLIKANQIKCSYLYFHLKVVSLRYPFYLWLLLFIILHGLIKCIYLHSFSEGFTESVIENGGVFYSYSNKIFASWDYCITSDKAAGLKKKNIYQDFQVWEIFLFWN